VRHSVSLAGSDSRATSGLLQDLGGALSSAGFGELAGRFAHARQRIAGSQFADHGKELFANHFSVANQTAGAAALEGFGVARLMIVRSKRERHKNGRTTRGGELRYGSCARS